MTKILIADDHPMVRDALRSAVGYTCHAEQVFEAGCLDDATRLLTEQGDMDLLLLDINMPGMNGLSGLVSLRNRFPATPVVVVSAHEDRKLVREVIQCGAAGFIPKSTPRDGIAAALRLVMEGGVYVPEPAGEDEPEDGETAEIARRLATLTPQQMRVLEMLGTGKLNKEIAYELSITETTVKAHVSAILQKLKVYSRTQAVVFANRLQMEQARTHF
ncbi:MAG TPA: response regulator transcription factor [Azospirillum sp.]|nr:response regulator transcription factor [Azospirillum sp.]